jgi:uncharacterized coiled-coil protein SlyX
MDEHQLHRLELLEDRLHEHIEHYAANNKQLALLTQRMEQFGEDFKHHDACERVYQKKVDDSLQRISELDLIKAKEIVEAYTGIMSFRSIIVGLAGVGIAVGTLGAGILGLIHIIRE